MWKDKKQNTKLQMWLARAVACRAPAKLGQAALHAFHGADGDKMQFASVVLPAIFCFRIFLGRMRAHIRT